MNERTINSDCSRMGNTDSQYRQVWHGHWGNSVRGCHGCIICDFVGLYFYEIQQESV